MIAHLLKEKSVPLVLFFLICSIPSFAFAEERKTSNKEVKDADYYFMLGLTYKTTDKYQESADAYKQAIGIKPDYAQAHFNLGLVYIIMDDKGSALDVYKILKDLDEYLANLLFDKIYP